jgi:hypothetical protein
MTLTGVNYLAIVIAAVAAWLVGAVWYMALAKPWMKAQGWTSKEEMLGPGGKPSPVPFILSFAAEFVMAWVLAGVLYHIGATSLRGGMVSAALIWVGFVATTVLVNNAFSKKPFMLAVIDGGHWLAVLLVMGAILGGMGPP